MTSSRLLALTPVGTGESLESPWILNCVERRPTASSCIGCPGGIGWRQIGVLKGPLAVWGSGVRTPSAPQLIEALRPQQMRRSEGFFHARNDRHPLGGMITLRCTTGGFLEHFRAFSRSDSALQHERELRRGRPVRYGVVASQRAALWCARNAERDGADRGAGRERRTCSGPSWAGLPCAALPCGRLAGRPPAGPR